ncbi:LysE family translocator [Actinomadura craniellae]|uniref:LysE family translocator n=1 Tax=Actinomadura craniellae TaxID=2231787 RepID=A0A365H951_9ACTN|nr:LysE family translocator [Actinomadura craniellae]RAY14793.1 LysE family translocator [Actinomadura craniellae]
MVDGVQLLAFAGVFQLGVMAPGPDFAVMVRNSALSGRTVGMATAFGIASGVFVWAMAAALGVAALLAASATAYTVVKLVGAGYLLYLGARAVLAAVRGGGPAPRADEPERGRTLWAGFRQGLLCNALNPKAAVFFVALMPQFLPASSGLADVLLLSLVAVALAALWFVLVANVVGALRRFFARPAVRRRLDAITGFLLVGLGLKLVVDR